MCCALCGPYPKWMGFDGVSLAMNKENVLWDTVETIHPHDGSTTPLESTVLKQTERILLSNTKTRALLASFCTSSPAPLTASDFTVLQLALQQECPSLAIIIEKMHKEEIRRTAPLHVFNYSFININWKQFILLLSSPTSMVWILRPAIIPTILHLITSKVYTQEIHQQLSTYCPPLAMSLISIVDNNVPIEFIDLLSQAIQVVQHTYPSHTFTATSPSLTSHIATTINDVPHKPKDIGSLQVWLDHLKTTATQIHNTHTPLSSNFDPTQLQNYPLVHELDPKLSGTYWSFPRLRVLPRFEGIDPLKPSTIAEWSDSHQESTETALFCLKEEKQNYSSQKHTAGLFVGSCLHAVCYGFHNMVAPEGRKDLLKVLYERFPQEVLNQLHVVYDFNCQEAEYMLNRLPEIFMHTRLFIDRWHATSHKCASVFKLQGYPVFQELVSTGAESLNQFLQYFHGQTPFMKQETAMIILMGFVGLRNYLINEELTHWKQVYTTTPS
jgi:hypothetical protein